MLRDYQQDMLNKIKEAMRHGHEGVCAVLPCRSGKSYIMKEIVDSACKKGSKVLILAHRRLLLSQHKKLIDGCRIESVFTEVNHLGEHGQVDLIIIDEAHISGAESYQKVCEYYKCKRILFTATACRLDGKPLNLCSIIINGISGDELIKRGDISPYDLYAPKLKINLNKVSMSGSDYNSEELGVVMMDRKIYGDIIKNYRKLGDGRSAIAYCANVAHAKAMCDLFNDNGISAVEIDATTSESEREKAMSDFKNGVYKVLCNCNLISEGITLPECDCVMLLRATRSESLFVQQSCRCLTPRDSKRAVIIDFVGNVFEHGMPTEQRIYTLTPRKSRNSKRVEDVLVRMCKSCLLVYSGVSRICPFCGADNGKTRKQIEEEEAELERIEKIEKRREVGRCQTFSQLVELAKRRGYNNPIAWANFVMEGREKKI